MLKAPFGAVVLVAVMPLCAAPPAADTFRKSVEPVLAKYCYGCHSDRNKAGNLSLEALREPAAALSHPEVWEKVLDKLGASRMPPPGQPAPAASERTAVETWAASVPGVSKVKASAGRVTARRLNRAEYNNTIRDLLGVSLRPADEFPVDDSGYGFDNIGDVLSLSPMLMEKYMFAARKLARAAVHGSPAPAAGSILAHYLGKRSGDAETGSAGGNAYLPFSMRGALYGTFVFPVTASYEFRFRVVDRRLDESHAVPVVLSIDGKPVFAGAVEGGRRGNYERGEYTARATVPAGVHTFRISFPHLAEKDPRENVAADKIRRLFAEYLDIVGPFAPVIADDESYRRVFSCGHARGSHSNSCTRPVVASLARRAWRRPPNATEIDKLTALAADGDPFEQGIETVLQALLCSADFLFRFEGSQAGAIGQHALASRLSYFLWSSMPDEELLRLADEGKLADPATVKTQVRRMLADSKAAALVENFAGQWLQLRSLARSRPDAARFPTADDELLEAMRTETAMFVAAIFREDRSIVDLLDAPFTYVNAPLARHYGINGVSGEQFQRVSTGESRRGLLTQASILTVSSYPTRTSPVIRGKWVLENILGAPPPPPPPNVPLIEESKIDPDVSFRKQLEQHRANPSCAACHAQMDAIGFGFESYDAVGAWRTHDGKAPVDSSGVLPGGRSFTGPIELIGILKAQAPDFAHAFTEKLLTYALGRGLERFDRPAVEQIAAAAARENYRFSTLVTEIVKSQPFQTRGAEGEK